MTRAAGSEPWSWSASTIARRVRAGEISALAVVEACLQRTRQLEQPARPLNAYVEILGEQALARADEIDRRRSSGRRLGALAGVPVALKDNLNWSGQAMSCGSRMLDGYRAPYTATAVQRLLDADAVILGRANLDEFAMGASGQTSCFGPTRNPWDRARVPGGSSSGCAAAVAAASVPVALGSDTGGSLRQPAALCGLVAIKPTYGRVSRYGLTAYASSLDQVGPLARDADDAELMLSVISGPDDRDATSEPFDQTGQRDAAAHVVDQGADWSALRFGIPKQLQLDALESEATLAWRKAQDTARSLGADLVEVDIPQWTHALALYGVLANCEASSNLARFDGIRFGATAVDRPGDTADDRITSSRQRGFGPEVQRRILLGTYLLGTYALAAGQRQNYYERARHGRRALTAQLHAALTEVDALLTPTTLSAAFPLGNKEDGSLDMIQCDLFTVAASLAGLPAVALPCALSLDGLPLSIQLLGRRHRDHDLLQLARCFQNYIDWEVRPARTAIFDA